MDLRWWKFIHLAGVLGLLGTHGVSMVVLFRLRRERDRRQVESLLQLSGTTTIPFYVSLAVLLGGGIASVLGLGEVYSFSQLWIWGSLALLAVTSAVMWSIASPYYRRLREALAVRPSGVPRTSDEELAALLSSGKPMLIAAVGFAALAVILWMMIFKPGLV